MFWSQVRHRPSCDSTNPARRQTMYCFRKGHRPIESAPDDITRGSRKLILDKHKFHVFDTIYYNQKPGIGLHFPRMAAGRDQDATRARKTLYITGFDPRHTTKELLEELFMQGGPVTDVKLFDTHAYVQFQDQDSVPYSLALFSEIELHGRKLRINSKHKSRESLSQLKYLTQVREVLREQYKRIPPPKLPPKKMPPQKQSPNSHRKRAKDDRKDGKTSSNSNSGNVARSDSKSSHRRRSRRQNCDTSRSSPYTRGGRGRR